jgi:hypothetical protein
MLEPRSEPRSVSSPRVSCWRADLGERIPMFEILGVVGIAISVAAHVPKWSTSREHRSAGVSSLARVTPCRAAWRPRIHPSPGQQPDGLRRDLGPWRYRGMARESHAAWFPPLARNDRPRATGARSRGALVARRFGKLSVGPRSYGGSCRRSSSSGLSKTRSGGRRLASDAKPTTDKRVFREPESDEPTGHQDPGG